MTVKDVELFKQRLERNFKKLQDEMIEYDHIIEDMYDTDIELDLHEIVNYITVENAHELAYLLSFGEHMEAGTALYNELVAWRNRTDGTRD